MRLRDQGDDREPEPAPACTSRLVGAAEAVERAIEEALGEAVSGVGDVQPTFVAILNQDPCD